MLLYRIFALSTSAYLLLTTTFNFVFVVLIMEGFAKLRCPQCIGAVDGIHILIKPPRSQAAEHVNRKSTYSILMQGTMDHSGHFINIKIGYSGWNHDITWFWGQLLFCSSAHSNQWKEAMEDTYFLDILGLLLQFYLLPKTSFLGWGHSATNHHIQRYGVLSRSALSLVRSLKRPCLICLHSIVGPSVWSKRWKCCLNLWIRPKRWHRVMLRIYPYIKK